MQKPNNIKIKDEAQTKKDILDAAMKCYGPEGHRQVAMHFDKYEKLYKNCKNDIERKHISKLCIVELYKLMQPKNGLSIDFEDILPADGKSI